LSSFFWWLSDKVTSFALFFAFIEQERTSGATTTTSQESLLAE
jgi:hypothetical protein